RRSPQQQQELGRPAVFRPDSIAAEQIAEKDVGHRSEERREPAQLQVGNQLRHDGFSAAVVRVSLGNTATCCALRLSLPGPGSQTSRPICEFMALATVELELQHAELPSAVEAFIQEAE